MRRYNIILILCLIAVVAFPGHILAAKKTKKYTVSATAAIFSDSTKTKRLYGKNVHKKVVPASTVKVMTALLVLERLPLNKVITVNSSALNVQPSKIYAKSGERYKASDLLYAILLGSANDAAVILAQAVSGSHKNFVKLMNKRARELGCRNTKFVNAHGLPTKQAQYTTPYDMYLIFRKALRHSFFRKAITYKHKIIYSLSGRKISLKNHNKILWKGWNQKLYGKTGWTKKAKACFVGYLKKGKSTLIIAVFGCTKRWDDIKYIVSEYGKINL